MKLYPFSNHFGALLQEIPEPGRGRHLWLFQVCVSGIHYASPQKLKRFLLQVAADRGWADRDFEKEIDDALYKVTAGQGQPADTPAMKWPPVNDSARLARNSFPPMFGTAPANLTAQQVLPSLFPGEPLLAFGQEVYSVTTMPLSDVLPVADKFAFLTPNPMTAEYGEKADGTLSKRCKANACATEQLKYLVVEFDLHEPPEWQAAQLSSLHSPACPLCLAVWSGGKSIHGWFNAAGLSPYEKKLFFLFAAYLGADRSLWDHSKVVRMPGGVRRTGERQAILYFEEEHL